MARNIVIAGNWKMNQTSAEGATLARGIKAGLACSCCCEKERAPEVVVCPPFLTISAVASELKGSCVKIGAQNVHWKKDGAYTGEISADMLKDAQCTHVIVGHSERRLYFGETDESVNQRAATAVKAGLVAIVCVGETLEERESNKTDVVVERQVKKAFVGFSVDDMKSVIIAYEPVWAIGTGKVATPEQAQDVHAFLRGKLAEMFNPSVADSTRILYGGSMNDKNAAELLAQKDVDGGLIGGASLDAEKFISIIKTAKKANA